MITTYINITSRGLQEKWMKVLEREFLGVLIGDGLGEANPRQGKGEFQFIAQCAREVKNSYKLEQDVGHFLTNLELMAVAVSHEDGDTKGGLRYGEGKSFTGITLSALA